MVLTAFINQVGYDQNKLHFIELQGILKSTTAKKTSL